MRSKDYLPFPSLSSSAAQVCHLACCLWRRGKVQLADSYVERSSAATNNGLLSASSSPSLLPSVSAAFRRAKYPNAPCPTAKMASSTVIYPMNIHQCKKTNSQGRGKRGASGGGGSSSRSCCPGGKRKIQRMAESAKIAAWKWRERARRRLRSVGMVGVGG